MLRNGEPYSFAVLSPRLEEMRRRLNAADSRGPGGLDEVRGMIADLLSETSVPHELSEFLQRISLLTEVWECLPVGDEGRSTLSRQNDEAIGRLLSEMEAGERGRSALDWLVRTSDAAWGRYLVLLDDSGSGDLPEASESEAEPDLGRIVEILTTGRPSPVAIPAKVETPRPRAETVPKTVVAPEPAKAPEIEPEPTFDGPLDDEILEAFRADVEDLMERFVALASKLTTSGLEPDLVHELGRCLHTLKGAAGAVGELDLVARVHDLEGRCERVLKTPGKEDASAFLDQLRGLLTALEGVLVQPESAAESVDPREVSRDDRPAPPVVVEDSAEKGQDGNEMIRVPRGQVDELLDLVAELTLLNSPRGAWAEKVKALVGEAQSCRNRLLASIDRLSEISPDLADLGLSPRGSKHRGGGPLADVMEVVESLTEQANDLALLAESARAAADPLADESQATNRLSHQLWELVHDVRIAPVRPLFQRLAGVAENAARVEGKRVEISFKGGDAELDRAIQDRIFEPLLHVVRNAVAHGIEASEVRVARSKPAIGQITIEARREDRSLTLTIRDDGRGLDYAAVEAKGRQLGLVAPADRPTIAQLESLIFRPGFSTTRSAGVLSGRGIGMDVVSRDVARLNGSVSLVSSPGRGMAVSINLPARLSLEELLIVRIDGQAFSLPLKAVDLSENRNEPGFLEPKAGSRGSKPLQSRGALGLPPLLPPAKPSVIFVRVGAEVRPVAVDAVEGARKLVVKPLNSLLVGHPAVSGTVLSSEGELILLLDPVGLVRLAESRHRAGSSSVTRRATGRVLLVDDSISVRKAMARHIRTFGLEVEEAFDGVEAIRKLRMWPFGLIMTDLQMPRMDGFELMAEIRRWGYPAPVIVASTRVDPDSRRRANDLGARGFIAKPARFEDVAEVLGSILNPNQGPVSST